MGSLSSCPGPDIAHRPTQKSAKAGERKYYLFAAAEHGCLACVRHLVQHEGVDPGSSSKTCKYSALGFAEWGARQNHGGSNYSEVITFLRESVASANTVPGAPMPEEIPMPKMFRSTDHVPSPIVEAPRADGADDVILSRRKRRLLEYDMRQAGLDTPVVGNMGSAIMQRLGWRPGEPLGNPSSSSTGQRLVEPLRVGDPKLDNYGLGFAHASAKRKHVSI